MKESRNKYMKSTFDPKNASDEQIRHWLFAIIDNELQKDEADIDYELIKLCSDWEAELDDVPEKLTDEEYDRILSSIKSKADTLADDPEAFKKLSSPIPTKRRTFKILTIAAAIVATVTVSLSVIAGMQGYSIFEFMSESFKKIVGTEENDQVTEDGITFSKNDELEKYSSVEEAIKERNLDIMYPSALPDGIVLTGISQQCTEEYDNEYTISFVASSNTLSISVLNHSMTNLNDLTNSEIYTVGNLKVYIDNVDTWYQAICQYNEMEYRITYDNYDDLIYIINNLKEIEK